MQVTTALLTCSFALDFKPAIAGLGSFQVCPYLALALAPASERCEHVTAELPTWESPIVASNVAVSIRFLTIQCCRCLEVWIRGSTPQLPLTGQSCVVIPKSQQEHRKSYRLPNNQ